MTSRSDMLKKVMTWGVAQPLADLLTRGIEQVSALRWKAACSVVFMSRMVKYRGDVLVCSLESPPIEGRECGVVCGWVELYQIVNPAQLTDEEWAELGILPNDREKYMKKYAYRFRNPRRLIEIPYKCREGMRLEQVYMDFLTAYPQVVEMDKKGWEDIQKRINHETKRNG